MTASIALLITVSYIVAIIGGALTAKHLQLEMGAALYAALWVGLIVACAAFIVGSAEGVVAATLLSTFAMGYLCQSSSKKAP